MKLWLSKNSNVPVKEQLATQILSAILAGNPAPGSRLPIPPQSLIAILSRWPEFLRWSQAVLVAAGASPDALLTVDARRKDWRTRIRNATAVITDTLHGPLISDRPKLYVVRLLSDDSRRAVRAFVDYLGVDNIAGPRSGTGSAR